MRRSELQPEPPNRTLEEENLKDYEENMNDVNTTVDRGGAHQDQGLRPPSPTGAWVYDRHRV